uniref:Uncharacterized protein n=1 Tax=Romanomermis culicivorax TaxID=13658 RepID=A0A915J9F0_ROMCU
MRRGDGKCDYKLIKNDSISKNYTSDLVDIDDDDLESVPLMESQNFYQNKNQVTVNNYQNQANTKIDSPISGSQQADNQSNVGTATPTAASRKSYIFNDSDEDLITNNSNSAQSSTENLPTDDFTVHNLIWHFCPCMS